MSTTEPPPATATAFATPAPSSSPPSTQMPPVTYVIIPLVTLASVFLIGFFAYVRRRHSRRFEASSAGDGGEAQMQERRRNDTDAADRWPPASLGLNWWFFRSNEGLNELGEAPPPYDVERRRKAATEGSVDATDEGAEPRNSVLEENEDRESRHSSDSTREPPRHSEENIIRRPSSRVSRRIIEEQRHSAGQQPRRSQEDSQATTPEEQIQHTQSSEEQEQEPQEPTRPIRLFDETPSEAHRSALPVSSSSSQELPGLNSSPRRQTAEEMAAILDARCLRNRQCRRDHEEAAAGSSSPADICNTEFFHTPSPSASPSRSRQRRIERLNQRLRRLGYATPDSSEHYGSQLRDMEDGAAPPDYERAPVVAVPAPAQLPPPLAADAPPPYPAPVVRRPQYRYRAGDPPMVRQTLYEHFPHHNYLFMPPLEHDYLVTSYSASLHSRF
ncbi:hypothetical protein CCM_01100 [Cordyceps militaris CM01]|uniref:Uncharacterized protein n=1 Tax=Cordyceps militaris (strain CM01) TaxID=983644 RepID=G3J363_CORMM|nr:uncharacterized protein CCM_01100 [Cordyceps militaris CM01]EGX96444.1 hypothetical protein CCM_01100 [Cordyceps militaris CM01]